MAKRTIEPLLWLLFSAGGVLAALLLPVLLFLFGLAFPLGWVAPPGHEHLLAVLRHPLTRVVLFLLCMLSLFHWAHRFRYTLYDGLQIKHLNEVINLVGCAGAVVGSGGAGYLLWQVPWGGGKGTAALPPCQPRQATRAGAGGSRPGGRGREPAQEVRVPGAGQALPQHVQD